MIRGVLKNSVGKVEKVSKSFAKEERKILISMLNYATGFRMV